MGFHRAFMRGCIGYIGLERGYIRGYIVVLCGYIRGI